MNMLRPVSSFLRKRQMPLVLAYGDAGEVRKETAPLTVVGFLCKSKVRVDKPLFPLVM
jgi:hypothetical protein